MCSMLWGLCVILKKLRCYNYRYTYFGYSYDVAALESFNVKTNFKSDIAFLYIIILFGGTSNNKLTDDTSFE
jgi:hypothetical protein